MSISDHINGTRPFGIQFSGSMRDDIRASVESSYERHGTVNVPVVAEKVRLRHEDENVALEDIEAEVLRVALETHGVISFDSRQKR